MAQLNDPAYLAFPFRIGTGGARTSERKSHIREQIEQVLFTNPNERVFRPEFGAGVGSLIFEPNASALWEITRKRLMASLAEALKGEVDPKTLEVEVKGEGEKLLVVISYALATIGHAEQHEFVVSSGG
jgi:phage baseplate assembly protein W